MRRSHLSALVVGLAVLSAGGVAAFDWPGWMTGAGGPEDRVLVFLVGSRDRVSRVRAAVDPARIVAETPDAIALREGRIVAVDTDAVPVPYKTAGWMDREIEIMYLQRVEWWNGEAAKPSGARIGAGGADEARRARIRELVAKDQLTAGEQLFLLQAMNDGLEF